MTKDGFQKGLGLFRKLGLKAIPEIRNDNEFEDMFKLWSEALNNPDDEVFYKACKQFALFDKFFPAVNQIKNILEGKMPDDNKPKQRDPYAHLPRY